MTVDKREGGKKREQTNSDRAALSSQTFTACVPGIEPVIEGSGETEPSTLTRMQRCSSHRDGQSLDLSTHPSEITADLPYQPPTTIDSCFWAKTACNVSWS